MENGLDPKKIALIGLTIGAAVALLPMAVFGAPENGLCMALQLLTIPFSTVVALWAGSRAERVDGTAPSPRETVPLSLAA